MKTKSGQWTRVFLSASLEKHTQDPDEAAVKRSAHHAQKIQEIFVQSTPGANPETLE